MTSTYLQEVRILSDRISKTAAPVSVSMNGSDYILTTFGAGLEPKKMAADDLYAG